tara:strand:- start:682 stop:1029 length:348 start_codon:yes stop_codon:yes gene_type:complete
MIDYDTQLISENTIDSELISYFKEYKQNHIFEIINELRRINTLTLKNSFNGWNHFVKGYIIHEIQAIIRKQTFLAKQKLAFIRCYETFQISDYEIPQLICNILNPKLIIMRKDEL